MKALKRLAASTMLALALVAGAATQAAAEVYICRYSHTNLYVGADFIVIEDVYYCS